MMASSLRPAVPGGPVTLDQHEPTALRPPAADAVESACVPFLDLLRIRLVEAAGGRSRAELTVGAEHLRTLGIMHGGVMATLLDTSMGMAAGSVAPAGHDVVTVQLNLHFIRPAWEGETLVAVGEVRHAGRRTAVARGEVHTAAGILAGSGSATFMFLPRAGLDAGGIRSS
jgi:uncharacterized protein (TIGR00369 family)